MVAVPQILLMVWQKKNQETGICLGYKKGTELGTHKRCHRTVIRQNCLITVRGGASLQSKTRVLTSSSGHDGTMATTSRQSQPRMVPLMPYFMEQTLHQHGISFAGCHTTRLGWWSGHRPTLILFSCSCCLQDVASERV